MEVWLSPRRTVGGRRVEREDRTAAALLSDGDVIRELDRARQAVEAMSLAEPDAVRPSRSA
jgi:hypothetical protein